MEPAADGGRLRGLADVARGCRGGVEVAAVARRFWSLSSRRVAPTLSGGGHPGGGPSGPCELAEVVAGQVECPLDVGFDVAAQA